MAGRRLDVRCFLEGIQVPFLGANISITTNQASTASISLVGTNALFKIRPKTHVLLVFWDEAGAGAWRLLWEGQVIGIGYSKSPESRAANIMCRDISNYWDYTLRHMVDNHNLVQLRNRRQVFYGNGNKSLKMSPVKNTARNYISNRLSKKNDSLPNAIKDLLADFTDQVGAYKHVNRAYRLNDQVKLISDDEIGKLIRAEEFQDIIKQTEGQNSGFTPVREVILKFCRMIYYNIVSTPSAPYIDGKLNSFILKPNLYGTLPPKCNVLLPDLCTSISYNRNFMAEPTRMLMYGTPFPDSNIRGNTFEPAFAVPETVFKQLKGKPGEADRLNQEYKADVLSPEEIEKGILPAEVNAGFPEWFAMNGNHPRGNKSGKFMKDAALNLVNYRWQMSKYANRSLSAVSDLNPWMVCNMPCAIFDSSRSYIGVIANITHTISASGGGFTRADCNLAYEVPAPGEHENSPAFPGWMNESFHPDRVGEAYKELLGCDAMEGENTVSFLSSDDDSSAVDQDMEGSEITGGGRASIGRHTYTLYNPFDSSEDSKYKAAVESGSAYSFADSYRRRSIATIEDLGNFYKYTNTEKFSNTDLPVEFTTEIKPSLDGDVSDIGYFLESRKAPIRAYMADIRSGRILDGR